MKALVLKLGVSRSMIYQWVKEGKFLAPTHYGKIAVWDERSVDEWMRQKEMEEKR